MTAHTEFQDDWKQEILKGSIFLFHDKNMWNSVKNERDEITNNMEDYKFEITSAVINQFLADCREKLRKKSSYNIDFSLNRKGEFFCYWIKDRNIVSQNSPSIDIESIIEKNKILTPEKAYILGRHSIACQMFYFIKDIIHKHQHHDPSTDTLIDLHSMIDDSICPAVSEDCIDHFIKNVASSRHGTNFSEIKDCPYKNIDCLSYVERRNKEWKRKTIYMLYRSSHKYLYNNKGNNLFSSIGIFNYIKSLKEISPNINDLVVFNDTQFEKFLENKKNEFLSTIQEKNNIKNRSLSLRISFIGIFISYLILLTGNKVINSLSIVGILKEITEFSNEYIKYGDIKDLPIYLLMLGFCLSPMIAKCNTLTEGKYTRNIIRLCQWMKKSHAVLTMWAGSFIFLVLGICMMLKIFRIPLYNIISNLNCFCK